MKNLVTSTAAIFALTACLGSSESELPDYYVGKTEPAPMLADNAKDIVEELNDTSGYRFSFLSPFSVGRNKLEKLSLLDGMRRGLSPRQSLSEGYTSLGISETGGSADGPCGGTVSVDISASQTNGKYTISLKDYCETLDGSDITSNGSMVMDMSGSDNAGSVKFTLDITSTDGIDTQATAGRLVWSVSSTGAVLMTLNMSSHDSKTDDSFKVENFVYEENLLSPLTISASGRVYASSLDGYVDITTPTKFTGESLYAGFSEGEMVFSAGSATTTLTVRDDGECDLLVDEDGDDVVELTETGECSGYLF